MATMALGPFGNVYVVGIASDNAFRITPAGVVTEIIDATGDGVAGFDIGDEVIIDPSMSCGTCDYCLNDEIVYCSEFGILGEHLPDQQRSLVGQVRTDDHDDVGGFDLPQGGHLEDVQLLLEAGAHRCFVAPLYPNEIERAMPDMLDHGA